LPPGFDAREHTVSFDWSKANSFLALTQEKIGTPEMRKKIKQADFLFDIAAFFIFIFHLFMSFYGVYYEIFSIPVFAVLFTITRTSLAAVGHYHCHRRKDGVRDWGDAFFDM
jgi:hypothetical protein